MQHTPAAGKPAIQQCTRVAFNLTQVVWKPLWCRWRLARGLGFGSTRQSSSGNIIISRFQVL